MVDLNFALLLLGHILGDFYFQTDVMAKNKDADIKFLLLHALEYSVCIGVSLLAGFKWSFNILFLWIAISISHILIDFFKGCVNNKEHYFSAIKKHSLIYDQLLHFSLLVVVWWFWGRTISLHNYIQLEIDYLPVKPVIFILGLLCVLKPVGIIIGKGEIWNFSKQDYQTEDSLKNAGKMIGYLERIIVLFFLMFHQYSAIAFVLTAKSIARFKEIENNKSLAEYYLIGTLLSVTSALIIAVLLGFCRFEVN